MTISYGSLCTGYDGLGLALTLAGVPIVHEWMAENDEAMSLVLKHEVPDVPNVGDIKVAPWHLAPRTDLMSSGDPCQSISIAGRQAGRDDPRFLWPWVRAAYREVKPGAIFFENVANIVSHDGGRTMAERFEHLREDGYEVRWTVLGACAVGAPHHRHRWYAVAVHAGRHALAARRLGGGKAVCGAPRSGGRFLLPTPRTTDTNGPGRTATLQGGDDLRTVISLLPTPTTSNAHGNDANNRGELLLPGVAVRPGVWGKYAEAVALWEAVTGVPAPEPTEVSPKGSRRLSPLLPEWMMGLRPGLLTDRLDRAAALKGAGNGVVPLAAAAAWRLLVEG